MGTAMFESMVVGVLVVVVVWFDNFLGIELSSGE